TDWGPEPDDRRGRLARVCLTAQPWRGMMSAGFQEDYHGAREKPGQWAAGRGVCKPGSGPGCADAGSCYPGPDSGHVYPESGDVRGSDCRIPTASSRMAALERVALCADRGALCTNRSYSPGAHPYLAGPSGDGPLEDRLQGPRTAENGLAPAVA